MRLRKDGVETRKRILAAACEVFSRKGYRDATHAEICKRAGTNTAAINYHFRDKETLYVEAWRLAFHRSIEAHPPDGGVRPGAAAEERLRGRIRSIVQRIADPQSHEFDIVQKELVNPTGLLAEVMHESIEPLRQGLLAIVRELLGAGASGQQVLLCQMSIKAQCLDLWIRERHRKMFARAGMKVGLPPLDLDAELIAEHVARFSLAGIREMRRRIESGEVGERECAREH